MIKSSKKLLVKKIQMRQKEIEENKLKNKVRSLNRAKVKVRRLIDSNMNKSNYPDKIITLTVKGNIEDREMMIDEFKKFMKRLRYKYGKLEYVSVIEKQKRGALHFHVVMFGMPYVKKIELQEKWRHGFVKINAIDNYYSLSKYLVKYMTKEIDVKCDKQVKRYLCSNGLEKPIIEENIDINYMIEHDNLSVKYSKKYESEYLGEVVYHYCER